MARKNRIPEEPENHERWLVSYADFITLLFAFFVVMYSVSSVNEGKYRILSETLEGAFSNSHRSSDSIQLGEHQSANSPIENRIFNHQENPESLLDVGEIQNLERDQSVLARISEEFEEALSPYIEEDLIEVTRDTLWVQVEIKSGILFGSGDATLSSQAIPLLKQLAATIKPLPNAIQVEGYTDNIPINTAEFPSNWELSASRAANLVHQFMREGIQPQRMAAIGYGEYHPIADNRFEDGRNKNRRVVLVLLSESAARHKVVNERRRLLDSTPKLPQQRRLKLPSREMLPPLYE